MESAPRSIYRFGPFQLDVQERILERQGAPIPLTPKTFAILRALLESPGHLLTKQELIERVWPDATVEEGNLARNIFTLRKLLGDDQDAACYIETVPKLGYRFVAPVQLVDAAPRSGIPGPPPSPVPQQQSVAGKRWQWRWAAPVILVLAVAAATAMVSRWQLPALSAPAGRTMLAVLPFQNLSGDAQQEYFGDGLTEEMIAQVSRMDPERLGVIARTSAMQYKGTTKNVQEIGRELGVSYLLESSFRREANRVRITAQLVRVSDQTHVWAQSYERDVREILPLESEVTQAIAREIRIKLSPQAQAHLASARPVDPQAYQFYLKGRYFWNKRTQEGFWKGIECFQQAIEKDPNYAQAYVGLADSYILLGPNDLLPSKQVYPLAKSAALRALALDDALAEAHASLGFVKLLYDWNPVEAEAEFRRAIELDSNYPTAHHWYAYDLAAAGRFDDAVREIRQAHELDPLSPIISADVAQILFLSRRYDEAIVQSRKTVDLDPNFRQAYWYLGLIYDQKGMFDQAVQAFIKAQGAGQADSAEGAAIQAAYRASGIKGYWQYRLGVLQSPSRKDQVSPYTIAVVYARLDDTNRALENLEKAYAERYPSMVFVKIEPIFDSLRADPRFHDLLRRIAMSP